MDTGTIFFSEYIEGSTGNNKALEIFNNSGAEVDLSDFRVEIYRNGAATASATILLSGTMAVDGVLVIAHGDADSAVQVKTDLSNNNINHNGDDAYVLRQISSNAIFDLFGVVGTDPGTGWIDGSVSTVDATLRRRSSVMVGNPNGFSPIETLGLEWEAYPDSNYDGLGSHSVGVPVSVTLAGLSSQPESPLTPGFNDVVLAGFQLTASAAIDFTAVAVSASGTAESTDLSSVRIFRDDNGNGLIDGSEGEVSEGPVAFQSSMVFSGLTDQRGLTGVRSYLVVADIAVAATAGRTVTIRLDAAGLTTTAATQTGTATGAVRTIEASVPVDVVINEVDYDQVGADTAEFIELFNRGTADVDLSRFALHLVDSGGGAPYRTLPLSGAIPAGGFFVVGNVPGADLDPSLDQDLIQNGPDDGIVLMNGTSTVDAVGYEGSGSAVAEGSATNLGDSNTVENLSLSRIPNGTDTNDNSADFNLATATPKGSNTPGQPDLTIQLRGTGTGTTGFQFTYSILVSNVGTASAVGVVAEFTLPTGLTYVGVSGSNGFTGVHSAGKVTISGALLDAGESALLTIPVVPPVAGTYTAPAGAAVADPTNTIAEASEANNATSTDLITVVTDPPPNSAIMTGRSPQAAGELIAGSTDVVLAGFRVTTNAALDLTGVTVTLEETATAADLEAFRIFADENDDGVINGGDANVSDTLPFATSLSFSLTGQTIPSATRSYLIVANVVFTATAGRSVAASVLPGAFATSAGIRSGGMTSASRTISAGIAPRFVTQPAGTTIFNGETATLSVSVTGTLTPSLQWFQGTTGITSNPISGANGTSFTTPALSATTNYWVRATNAAGIVNSNTAKVTVIEIPDARLSNLALSDGSLDPLFSSDELFYSLSVPGSVSQVTLTPTSVQSASAIRVNSETVASGSASAPIPLSFGNNLIFVVVTQETISQTYAITVFRRSNNATLSGLALSAGSLTPGFDSGIADYTAFVPFSTTWVAVTPITENTAASVTVNGIPSRSGVASAPVVLKVGANPVTVNVTSQDGTAEREYRVVVNRHADSSLSALLLSQGNLSPVFAPGTLNYEVTVPFPTASLTLTPSASSSAATIRVANEPVLSGAVSAALPLEPGVNPIAIEVSGEDGAATVYHLSVRRLANPALANLDLFGAEIEPSFDPEITDYSLSVPSTVTELRVRPTAVDPNGTITVNGSSVVSGSESQAILLSGGANRIEVVSIARDGLASRVYHIDVQRNGSEIEVSAGDRALNHGSSIFDVGGTLPGRTVSKVLTIRNLGQEALTGVSAEITGDSRFRAELEFDTVEPGTSTKLTVSFQPFDRSESSATLAILSSDEDESPYVITVTGSGDPRAAKPVVAPEKEAQAVSAVGATWERGFAGVYDGLIWAQGDAPALLGAVTRVVISTPAGGALHPAISGVIEFKGRVEAFKGTFRSGGQFETSVVASDGSILGISLQLMKSTEGGAFLLRGSASLLPQGGRRILGVVDLPQAPYKDRGPRAPGERVGRYTVVLPSESAWNENAPGGDGWALVTVNRAGVFDLTGVMGDGVRFTETGYLSAKGEVSIFRNLYASVPERGRIGGKLIFREQPGISDFDGRLRWTKFGDQKEGQDLGGFDLMVWAVGARYTAPRPGARMLPGLADHHYNAEWTLIGPTAPFGDGDSGNRALSWLGNHRLLHFGPEQLRGGGTPSTGKVEGSFRGQTGPKRVDFSGVALQKQGIAAGLFVNEGLTGALRILADTKFPYPGSESLDPPTRVESTAPWVNPSETAVTFSAAAAGNYSGILTQNGDIAGALEEVTVTVGGQVSGTLWIHGRRQSFKGSLGGVLTASPGTAINLQLMMSAGGYALDGAVITGGGSFDVDAQQHIAFSASSPAPHAGAYTIVVRAPDGVKPESAPGGDGYGALVVSGRGLCTGTLHLADGTTVTFGGSPGRGVSTQTEWAFHRGLYGKTPRGYVAGKIVFREVDGVSDLDGEWRWVKDPGAPPVRSYPSGFDLEVKVVGSRYAVPAAGVRAMDGLAEAEQNIWCRWSGVDLSTSPELTLIDLNRTGTWTAANRLVCYGPEAVSVRFNPRTGLLTGTAVDKARGINLGFGAALLQKQDLLGGSYRVGGKAGLFVIESRNPAP